MSNEVTINYDDINVVIEQTSNITTTTETQTVVVEVEETQNIVVEQSDDHVIVQVSDTDNVVIEQTNVEIVNVQNSGTQGPAGLSTQIYLNLEALENISALKVVTAGVSIADKDTNPRAIGMAKNSIDMGDDGLIVTDGIVQDPFFSFIVGQPIFLGINGAVTQTPPTSGWLVTVGTALKTDTIKLELQSLKIQLL